MTRERNPDRMLPAGGGFTLVELLIVIVLLGLLMTALLTNVGGATLTAEISRCKALVRRLALAAESYSSQRRFGDYPPDDFQALRGSLKLKADFINPGIESFLAYVNRNESRHEGFLDPELLCNTDGDRFSGLHGKLQKSEKFEVVDPWGNPIAYFHKRNYKISQLYKLGEDESGEGEPVMVQAWKDETGAWIHPRKFQIFSAGPDGIFNTGDDVGNFETPNKDS